VAGRVQSGGFYKINDFRSSLMKLAIEVGFSGVLEYLVGEGHVEPKEATNGGISGLIFLYHKM
jgi:hypothetical protein